MAWFRGRAKRAHWGNHIPVRGQAEETAVLREKARRRTGGEGSVAAVQQQEKSRLTRTDEKERNVRRGTERDGWLVPANWTASKASAHPDPNSVLYLQVGTNFHH